MSQIPPKHHADAPASKGPVSKDPTPKKKGGVLRVVLIVVMLVLFGLLGWDLYARSAVASSFDKVVAWVGQDLAEYTPADVQKLLGRRPDRGLEDKEDYAVETYSWPRGMLVKSYFITVVYRKEGDKVLLHEVVKNTEPEANDLPNPPAEIAPPTGDELEPAPTDVGDEPPATGDASGADDPATSSGEAAEGTAPSEAGATE